MYVDNWAPGLIGSFRRCYLHIRWLCVILEVQEDLFANPSSQIFGVCILKFRTFMGQLSAVAMLKIKFQTALKLTCHFKGENVGQW